MVEFANGCTQEETLVTYSMFCDNPHIILIDMFEEEGEESVVLYFKHYGEEMMVSFFTGTDVGEVYTPDGTLENFGQYLPYGQITREKLFELLESLPHIDKFLFEVGSYSS